eukprot:1160436-Pelagomonas_calceolata.AAC.10
MLAIDEHSRPTPAVSYGTFFPSAVIPLAWQTPCGVPYGYLKSPCIVPKLLHMSWPEREEID